MTNIFQDNKPVLRILLIVFFVAWILPIVAMVGLFILLLPMAQDFLSLAVTTTDSISTLVAISLIPDIIIGLWSEFWWYKVISVMFVALLLINSYVYLLTRLKSVPKS